MIIDDDITGTIAEMQKAGALPWQVLETLKAVDLDPDLFMPDWQGVAEALQVARARLRIRRDQGVLEFAPGARGRRA